MVQDYWGWSEGSRTVKDDLNISYLHSYSYSYWYLDSRTGRDREIYLVSEECGGRWWDSGKKFNYFYICIWINGWRQGKMGDLPGLGGMRRTLVGQWEKKNLIIFIFLFGLMGGDRARWEIYLFSEECRGHWWDSGEKLVFCICICI